MGLVGLYACIVRRLRTEERNAPIFLALLARLAFLGCFALAVAFRGLSCVVAWVASLLLFVGFSWVVGVSFSLRMIATKRKGAPCWRVLSSFVGLVTWFLPL